jgi:ribonuclease P protein component
MRDERARRSVGRLTKRPEFLAAAAGRRFHSERLTVQGRLRDEDALGLRCGLTVTKRVGHATERNRIRRRLRAAVERAATGHLDRDLDIVVIGRREALGAPYDALVDDLERALRAVAKPKAVKPTHSSLTDGDRRGTSHA